jgi:hypothetical protein
LINNQNHRPVGLLSIYHQNCNELYIGSANLFHFDLMLSCEKSIGVPWPKLLHIEILCTELQTLRATRYPQLHYIWKSLNLGTKYRPRLMMMSAAYPLFPPHPECTARGLVKDTTVLNIMSHTFPHIGELCVLAKS